MKRHLKKIRSLNLGQIKTWQSRLTTYTGILSFVMIFYLFIVENKWMEWYFWILLIVSVTIVVMWVDIVIIFPQQLAYSRIKDPEWMRSVRNQKREMQNQQRIMKKVGIENFYQEYEE